MVRKFHSLALVATAASLGVSSIAPTQSYIVPPSFTGEVVSGSEPGLGLPLPGATPEEYSAAMVWGLRSGLNVAALQCAHSPFLDTTANYNAMITDHRGELAAAYQTLTGYFARSGGGAVVAAKGRAPAMSRAAMQALNQYDTRSYNGWSTLYAQRGFCNQAGAIGKELRFVPRGGLLTFAQANMRSLRNSLVSTGDPLWGVRGLYVPLAEIRLPDNCYDRQGQVKAKCLR
ncbi:MAG: hypothetical protein ABIO85_02145 [Sphingomicrobium sp.]